MSLHRFGPCLPWRRRTLRACAPVAAFGGLLAVGSLLPAASAIDRLPVGEAAIVGAFARGPLNVPLELDADGFAAVFGSKAPDTWPSERQCRQFFADGGSSIHVVRVDPAVPMAEALSGSPAKLSGIHALTPLSEVGIVVVPDLALLADEEYAATLQAVRGWIEAAGRHAFLILDPPPGLANAQEAVAWATKAIPSDFGNAAVYFPYLEVESDTGVVRIGASGAMAAVFQRSDAAAGIWESPAGTGFPLQCLGIHPAINAADSDLLNTGHVNPIRTFPGIGVVPFGSRTSDRLDLDQRFIAPVRLVDWIRSSVERGLAFTAVADNGPALWAQIRSEVEDFLMDLYRDGAFAGTAPDDAFFVRCDASTTTPADIAEGRVNVLIGVAPIRPAEFVVISIARETYDGMMIGTSEVPPRLQFIPDGARVVFPTVPGHAFRLEATDDPSGSGWTPFGSWIEGDGSWVRQDVPIAGERALFRVSVLPLR